MVRLYIEAINLQQAVAFLSNGQTLDIVNMFDVYGRETTDPKKAITFTATNGKGWFSDLVSDYEQVSLH